MIGVEPDHYWPSFSRNGPDIKTDIFYQNYGKLHTFFLKYVYILDLSNYLEVKQYIAIKSVIVYAKTKDRFRLDNSLIW